MVDRRTAILFLWIMGLRSAVCTDLPAVGVPGMEEGGRSAPLGKRKKAGLRSANLNKVFEMTADYPSTTKASAAELRRRHVHRSAHCPNEPIVLASARSRAAYRAGLLLQGVAK